MKNTDNIAQYVININSKIVLVFTNLIALVTVLILFYFNC